MGKINLGSRILKKRKFSTEIRRNEMFRSRCLSRDREMNLSLAAGRRLRERRRECTAREENGYAASPAKSGIFKAGG